MQSTGRGALPRPAVPQLLGVTQWEEVTPPRDGDRAAREGFPRQAVPWEGWGVSRGPSASEGWRGGLASALGPRTLGGICPWQGRESQERQ